MLLQEEALKPKEICIKRSSINWKHSIFQRIILIKEIPTENWGIRGGQAACDVDLGFKVDV
jgi:hypothetical protein